MRQDDPVLVACKHHLKGIYAVRHFFFVLHLDYKFKGLKLIILFFRYDFRLYSHYPYLSYF